MAIAEVKSVINSCFINGSSAYVGQTIDYGDVIETYNIDIGLEESFKSKLIENDGILTIEFLAEKPKKPEQMRIKSHSKVIFKSGGIGQVGPNTIRLDVGCEVIGKPGKPIGEITLPLGFIFIKKVNQSKFRRVGRTGYPVRFGEIIKTGMKSRIVVKFYNLYGGGELRMGQGREILLMPDNIKRVVTGKDSDFWGTFKYLVGRKANVGVPTAVCAIRG